MLQLDRNAIFRLGSPTLGVPMLELAYRGVGRDEPELPVARVSEPVEAVVPPWVAAIAALEARVARLEQPWWARVWVWLRQACQRLVERGRIQR